MVNINDFSNIWQLLQKKLCEQYGEELDLPVILLLIGVQETGKIGKKFSKSQKLDLMHVATCKLLSQWGYYDFEGIDSEGWPHYKLTGKLPILNLKQQEELLKRAIVEYFSENKFLAI